MFLEGRPSAAIKGLHPPMGKLTIGCHVIFVFKSDFMLSRLSGGAQMYWDLAKTTAEVGCNHVDITTLIQPDLYRFLNVVIKLTLQP